MSSTSSWFGRKVLLGLAATMLSIGGCAGDDAPVPESEESAATASASGQQLWDDSQQSVFNDKPHHIELKINKASWAQLHDDEKENGCVKADDVKWWHVREFTVDGQKFPNAAIKVKGNTSRCIPRPQFSVRLDRTKDVFKKSDRGVEEIDYDAATKGAIEDQRFHGMQAFSLRRSVNDSSSANDYQGGMLARESVATWAMAQTEEVHRTTKRGAPVYRTAYTTVQFNLCANDQDQKCDGPDNFKRVYAIAEDIGEDFFKQRYDDDAPTAFSMSLGCALKLDGRGKHTWNADCLDPELVKGKKFKSDDPEAVKAVKAMFDGPDGLVTRLQAARSKDDVEKVLHLDSFLNYAAGATVTGHWDSAFGNFNNDVLYFEKATNRWRIITWDMDNTFDFDNAVGKPTRNYAYRSDQPNRAIFDTIFAIPEVDRLLKKRINEYLGRLYANRDKGRLHDRLGWTKTMVKSLNDELHPAEAQNLALSQEMEDYARVRFDELKKQLR